MNDLQVSDLHRAWYYGDGLFETIRCVDGVLQHPDLHIDRLLTGLRLMGFSVPKEWNTDFFVAEIAKSDLKIAPVLRVRLTVWRAPGGLYLPIDNRPLFHISLTPTEAVFCPIDQPGIRMVVCPTVKISIDPFSAFKALNAPRYVQGARYAQQEGFDDALMLNSHSRICDATSSSVFWMKKGQLFTTAITEGCVWGTISGRILRAARDLNIPLSENWLTREELPELEGMFLTNAIRGIVPVAQVGDVVFERNALLDDWMQNLARFLKSCKV